jgi:hypothetical protein
MKSMTSLQCQQQQRLARSSFKAVAFDVIEKTVPVHFAVFYTVTGVIMDILLSSNLIKTHYKEHNFVSSQTSPCRHFTVLHQRPAANADPDATSSGRKHNAFPYKPPPPILIN